MKNNSKTLLTILACCLLAGIAIAWNNWSNGDPAANLLNTDPLVIKDLKWNLEDGRCAISGLLSNQSSQPAISVIVILEVHDPQGNLIATNPMVEVLALKGNSNTPFHGSVPIPRPPAQVTAAAKVAAVRWE